MKNIEKKTFRYFLKKYTFIQFTDCGVEIFTKKSQSTKLIVPKTLVENFRRQSSTEKYLK